MKKKLWRWRWEKKKTKKVQILKPVSNSIVSLSISFPSLFVFFFCCFFFFLLKNIWSIDGLIIALEVSSHTDWDNRQWRERTRLIISLFSILASKQSERRKYQHKNLSYYQSNIIKVMMTFSLTAAEINNNPNRRKNQSHLYFFSCELYGYIFVDFMWFVIITTCIESWYSKKEKNNNTEMLEDEEKKLSQF